MWSELIQVFERTLQSYDLVIKHNVPFKGGDFSQWINPKWAGVVCARPVEVKKIYMDEWTGEKNDYIFNHIGDALQKATKVAKKKLREI